MTTPNEQPPGQHAELVGVGDIYQAGRDQHHYYQDRVRSRRRAAGGHVVDECPYPGLAAFGSQHAQWFFGRDHAIADLTMRLDERLRVGRPLIIVAPSGAGKSSLLRAGLLPALADGALENSRHWPQLLCTPTARPMTTLAHQLARATGADPNWVVAAMRTDRTGCLNKLRQTGARLVIVVDQLEELFTQCPNEQERHVFLVTLSRLAALGPDGQQPTALVIYGLRADFYARGAEYPVLRNTLQHDQVLVGPMSAEELREAILYPAQHVGLQVEPGLVEVLLSDVGAGPNGVGYEAGRLPLLAHALRATWQQRHGHLMTVAGYEATGRIQGAVATTAEQTFAHLTPASRQATRMLFLRLIVVGDSIQDTRRRVDRAGLIGPSANPGATAAALDAFTRARLLTQQQDTVEITHEALLRAWPRLAEWLNTDRAGLLVHRRLIDAVKAWLDVRRDAGSLYRGAQLADLRAWLAGRENRAADLSTAEREFVTASVAAEEAEREFIRRNNRRLRRGIAALAVLVVITLTAAGVALWQQQVATAQRAQALAAQAIALSREYAAESLAAGSIDPRRSLLLAAAAWQASPTEEAHGAILSAQTTPYEGTLGPADARLVNVALSPDGTIAALATFAGTVTLWDTASRRELAQLTGPDGQYPSVVFSPDGRTLATDHVTTHAGKWLRLWDVHTHNLIRTLPVEALGVAFSPDGGSLVTVDGPFVALWDVASGRRIRDYGGYAVAADVAMSHDGSLIAAGGADGTVHLWQTATGTQVAVLTGHTKAVFSVDFNRDDTLLASAGADGTVRLWDVARRRAAAVPVLYPPGGNEFIRQALFSPDGSYVAAGMNRSRAVQLWRVADGANLGAFVGHTEGILAIAFSRDGQTLLSASADRTGMLWKARSAFLPQPDPVSGVAFSPDGHLLASSSGQRVTLWDPVRRDLVRTLAGGGWTGAQSLSFSPDGTTLATAGTDGTVRLWNVRTGTLSRTIALDAGLVGYYVTFSPDGRTLAVTAGPSADAVTSLAVTPPYVYVVRQWDVATGNVLVTTSYNIKDASTDPYPGGPSVFSPDSTLLATPLSIGSIELRQARTGVKVGGLVGRQDFVTTLAFNQDGTMLASGGTNRTLLLWDVATRRPVGTPLVGHNGAITGVAFLPDGRTLASVSDFDTTLRLWDIPVHAPLAVVQGTAGSFNGIAVQPGTGLIATAANNDAVVVWNADPAGVLGTVCQALRGPQSMADAWKAIGGDPSRAPRC